jgi:hypothetical protein
MSAISIKRWIRLDQSDDETGVMVSPENEDRFALSMELAIRGCKLGSQLDRLSQQIGMLLHKLHEWVRAHNQQVDQAYVVIRGDGLLFLVVQKEKRFNAEIEDELTQLDMEIAQAIDFDLVAFSVLALPKSDKDVITSFLTQDSTVTYRNAERSDSPGDRKSQSGLD